MAANNQQSSNKKSVGFDCEFVEPPPEQFIQSVCPVCLLIVRDPTQVECCGKKFCKACIERIKASKNPCPTCNKKDFSSYSDKGLKQALYGLKVRCSHQQEKCEWTGELGQLDKHLNIDPVPEKQLEGCQCVKIACIYDCGEEMQRKDIENHQNDHCPNRPFSCEHCRVYKATYNNVTQTHWLVCGSFPLSCPNKCGSTQQRQNIDSHIAKECPLTTINCDFHHAGCTVTLPRQNMPEHIKMGILTHVSLLASLVSVQQNKIKNLETENKQLKAKLELQVNNAPLTINSRPLGPPILTMTNYQQYKRNNDNWYSPGVYTHPRGYKICLRVRANGFSTGKETYVSVYINFMKGEFDDTLKWPFQGTISFQLLDQANGTDHKTSTIIYNDKAGNDISDRVTEGDIAKYGLGSMFFIPNTNLEPKYLHNNTLLFQIYKVEVNEK